MKSDKKMAVLAFLQALNGPTSLHDLKLQLEHESGQSYPERSLRRWLSEFINEGLVTKIGEKGATVYQTAALAITDTPDSAERAVFSAGLQSVVQQISQPLFKRDPASYHFDWVNSYRPNVTHYLNQQQLDTLQSGITPTANIEPAGTYARRIYNRLLVDLSFNSSRLEGNTYSLLDTEKLVVEGLANDSKLDEEKVMILNHKEAIRYLVDNVNKLGINVTEVCTLHYLLSDGLIPASLSGQVRKDAVRIGGSTYMPLERYEKINSEMDMLLQKAREIHNPFEQSLFLLIHLSYLQPFSDVNKRTSRLAANIPLLKNNLCPLSFNDVGRDDYLTAILAIYELRYPQLLAELYCYSHLRTQKQYDHLVDTMVDEVRVRYRPERREIVRKIICEQVVGESMNKLIHAFSSQRIAAAERTAFIEDVQQDIAAISPAKIAGLGVSTEELASWQKLMRSEQD